jgi:Fe-Mn family superoxide dismutase
VGTYAGGTVLVRERAQVGSERTDLVLGEVQLEPPSNPIKAETIVKKVESSSNEGPVRRRTALMADPPTSPSSAQKRSFSTTPSSAAGGPLSERGPMSEILYSTGVSSSSIGFGTPLEGVALRPLVCLSVHPHCYLQDYGVWGREQYVKNWWEAINWTKVEASYASITRKA